MPEAIRRTPSDTLVSGWDFSTGSVKCLTFDLRGKVVAEVRLPTDLFERDGAIELSALQLEGQARATVRGLAAQLRDLGRLNHWLLGGISATHHTAGRLDAAHNPIRRLICWNDQTLAEYHAAGLKRLGGPGRVQELIGGPWAVRYSLSHLVKDETTLTESDWKRTSRMLPHGPMAAGFLTGRFDLTSISSAASTGIMDLRTNQWRREMLDAIASPEYRQRAWESLPAILDGNAAVAPLADHVAMDAGLPGAVRPMVFATLDDQAAGLVGGGATDAGHVAIILGNSAVVNSSAARAPTSGTLDAMKLNWGPYLWMRCYSNGAQFVDRVVGPKPDWAKREAAARAVPAGCGGVSVLPFVLSEPSIGVTRSMMDWTPNEPLDPGLRLRAAYEAVAYLMALAVREHEAAGQQITRVTVSGGMARSELMCEILASVLNRRIERLESSEGPALGAAVAALAGYEQQRRTAARDEVPFTVADAVAAMVNFKAPVDPVAEWCGVYAAGIAMFQRMIRTIQN